MVTRWLIALVLGCTLAALAQSPFMQHRRTVSRPGPSGGACGTISMNNSNSTVMGDVQFGGASGDDYRAGYFVATESATICAIEFFATKVATPTWDMVAEIWSLSGGQPGTLIAASDSVASSVAPTFPDHAWINFPNVGASISSGTTYTVVFRRASGTADGANYLRIWDTTTSDPGHDTLWKSSDGATWVADDIANINTLSFKLYK